MSQIFISFIHEEEKVAKAVQVLLQDLLGRDLDVFMSADRWKIYAGEIWLDRISQELRAAKVVILILSPKSVTRPWVNFEAGAAWIKEGTKIIPACFGGLSKDTLPKPYSSIQALDLQEQNDQYYLVTSVCHHLGKLPPPPPLPESIQSANEQVERFRAPYRGLKASLEEFGPSA